MRYARPLLAPADLCFHFVTRVVLAIIGAVTLQRGRALAVFVVFASAFALGSVALAAAARDRYSLCLPTPAGSATALSSLDSRYVHIKQCWWRGAHHRPAASLVTRLWRRGD